MAKETSKGVNWGKKKRRQRNTAQMMGQGRNSQDQISKEETGKLPEKIIQNNESKDVPTLGNRMEKIQEATIKDIEEVKNKQR